MKVATLEAQVSVIKSEPPVRLEHFSPYPPGWRRMIAVYLYIFCRKRAPALTSQTGGAPKAELPSSCGHRSAREDAPFLKNLNHGQDAIPRLVSFPETM